MAVVAGPETASAKDFGVIVSIMKSPTEPLIFYRDTPSREFLKCVK